MTNVEPLQIHSHIILKILSALDKEPIKTRILFQKIAFLILRKYKDLFQQVDFKPHTLITGFGSLKTGYRVPDVVLNILRKYKFPITRIICFTTPDGKAKREDHIIDKNLIKIDEFVILPYKEYRHTESEFFQRIEDILSKEMKEADIIIDITPLSKLFSFKLLELANKYPLPCVYLGIDKNEEDKLF